MDTIEIRKAALSDAQDIYRIEQYWRQKYRDGDYSKGYLRVKNNYSLSQIEKIIAESEAAVAIEKDRVLSYYFINPFFDTGDIAERKTIIKHKTERGELPYGRYAYSLQAATAEGYAGKGLNRQALRLLQDLSKDKYDYLIGIMSYDNLVTQKSSLKMGWKHYGDVGIGILAVIGTTKEKNNRLT